MRAHRHLWLISFELGMLVLSAVTGWPAPDAAASTPVRVALVSDTHIDRGTNGPLHRSRFEKVIAQVNQAKVDVVLMAGDLTENGRPEELREFRALAGGFQAPVLWVPGNHDLGAKVIRGKNREPKKEVNAYRVARYEMEMGPSYFVREAAGLRVVGINGSLLGSGLGKERRMWSFLETVLSQPVTHRTLALIHYPPFVNKPNEAGGEYWNVEPQPRARLLTLLKQGGVAAVLSGHLHRPIAQRQDGILFLTTHPAGFGLPAKKQPEGWTLLMVPPQGEIQFERRNVPR
jgi:3',5'-cyclic AMP phosphodiesterase CpdA